MTLRPPIRSSTGPLRTAALLLVALAAASCEERSPTSVDVTPLPPEPVTLEVELPWSQFASNLEVFGGYSSPGQLDGTIIALDFADTLDARTLISWGSLPTAASVRDSAGTLRTDLNLTYRDGYVAIFLDPVASTPVDSATLALGAIENDWHAVSATWTASLDTIGDQRLWPEEGAGPVLPIAPRTWIRSEGDSVQFFMDSATTSMWRDAATAARGVRVDLLSQGQRIRIVGAALRVFAGSSIAPDTVLTLTAGTSQFTFVYTPSADPPTEGMRIGGAPAWRTVFDVNLSATLSGPPALCAAVGCPFTLGPQDVSYAGLTLRSKATEAAFQPTDTVSLDVRAVLQRSAMPKSPLTPSLIADPVGLKVGPDPFGPLEGTPVEIPITPFLKGYLAGPDPAGRPPPTSLVLLSANEPEGFAFASFFGPGTPNEPVLKLILTVSPPMELQ